MRGSVLSFVTMMTALSGTATVLSARPLHRPAPSIVELPPLEAKGCYYYRGERRCGSYCYWEVNGRRYCQQREHDAFPQAELWVEEAAPSAAYRGARHDRRLK